MEWLKFMDEKHFPEKTLAIFKNLSVRHTNLAFLGILVLGLDDSVVKNDTLFITIVPLFGNSNNGISFIQFYVSVVHCSARFFNRSSSQNKLMNIL